MSSGTSTIISPCIRAKKIDAIDRAKQIVTASDGTQAHYDRLILATGSMPFMLPLPGADKEGVIAFRDIKDVDTMLDATKSYPKAVVIGGGLLGLEAAYGLMKQGMEVTVVHLGATLMDRQLDTNASQLLQKSLEERGMKFLMQHSSAEILGDKRVSGLKFNDGTWQKQICSSWPWASSLILHWHNPVVCIVSAVLWLMTRCKRTILKFMPWANVYSIVALPMAWSRRYLSKLK